MAAVELRPPAGYRIERDSSNEFREPTPPEILFHVVKVVAGDDPQATVVVLFSRRDGWWYVCPIDDTGRMEGDEAQAIAVALAMAGEECVRRNGDAS